MQRFKRFIDTFLAGLVGAMLAAGVGVIFLSAGYTRQFGEGLVHWSYDAPVALRSFERKAPALDEIAIVYMDEGSHVSLGQPFNEPWDRRLHARLLDRLKEAGAKIVVFDVVFSDPGLRPTEDDEFARAIRDFGKVALAADAAAKVRDRASAEEVVPPTDQLLFAALEEGTIGRAEVNPDGDGVVRRHIPGKMDEIVPTLAWAAADLAGAPAGNAPNQEDRTRWIQYYGPPLTLPHRSFDRVLDTNAIEVDLSIFKDSIVFVGARTLTKYTGGRKDEYESPYSFWLDQEKKFMPGVEFQATMCLNLLRGEWLARLPYWPELWGVILAGIGFGFGLAALRPILAVLAGVIGIALVVALGFLAVYQTGTWFAWTVVVAGIAVAMLWSVVYNSISLYVQKRLMQHSLGMYVSPSQVKKIINRPDILKPGAEKQEISILFSDIENFTGMSEGMDSNELADLMNNYFEDAVTNCIHKTDGTVIKYIGDAIFAIWNAPDPQADHQERACRGALLLRDQVTSFKGGRGGVDVRTRIGLHTGVANVGNFGSSARIDYTALGESVNMAARMEGLNKHLGTSLVITGDVEKAVRDRFVTRFVGKIQLKGFEKAVDVYELISLPEAAPESRPWRTAFAEALECFAGRKFDEAEERFRKIVETIRPGDGPSQFYLSRIAEFRGRSLPEDWSGQIDLKEK